MYIFLRKKLFLLGIIANIVLFAILLIQNPFSNKNILSDLYPYPDTINYINPAINILHGYGFKISREGRSLPTDVPPLYSAALIPIYLINHDPRMFYFTNVFLALISLFLFFLDLRLITKNKLILFFVLFIYVTSYFIYWYPSLAMAENLFLPLFLSGVCLLFTKVSNIKLTFAAVIGLSFVSTKYALAPLTFSYYFLYMLKISLNPEKYISKARTKVFKVMLFLFVGLITYAIFSYSEHINKGVDFFLRSKITLTPMLSTGITTLNTKTTSIFSYNNFGDGWIQYIAALMGGPLSFAGLYLPIVPVFVGMLGLPTMFYGLTIKKLRFISLSFIIMLFVPTIFMSTFKTVDGRYIYYAIPILIFVFTIFLSEAEKFLSQKKLKSIYIFGMICLLSYYLYTSVGQIHSQVVKNIYGDKQPLNYNTVLLFNSYFQNSLVQQDRKPVVISGLVPYFVDFYSNDNYRLLPLSPVAYFANYPEEAWGINHTQNLFSIYDFYLKKGNDVYVSDSGIYYGKTKYVLDNINNRKEEYYLAFWFK